MQTQVLVQPPPLLALHRAFPTTPLLPDPSTPHLMDKKHLPAAQSGPNSSPALHIPLDDHLPRSGPRDHASLTSPQQYSISVPIHSQPTVHIQSSHPRALSPPLSGSHPESETTTEPAPRIAPRPSPLQLTRPAPSFPPPFSAPHHSNHFALSETSSPPNMDRYSIANLANRYLRGSDKYSHNQHPLTDQRRMSEPAMYGSAASSRSSNTDNLSNARYHQHQHQYSYVPPRSYAVHSSSPIHPSSDTRPIGSSSWKADHPLSLHSYDSVDVEEPLSPLNPTFSGGESSPPMGMSGALFGYEDYGPSPPGTGTSTSSNAPATHHQAHTTGAPSSPSNSKQYSFVSLPGNVVKKRPRRRYDEIERLYQCSWPSCTKSYGTLNHLNAHITMQKHGPKRSPNEFKELRKQWRKAKKEEAEAVALDAMRHGSHQHQHQHLSQHHASHHSMPDAEYQTHNIRPPFDYTHHSQRPVQPIDLHDTLAPRRSSRYTPIASPHPQHSGIAFSHPHAHSANTSNIPLDRLPPNSTLLTGYQPSSVGSAPSFNTYSSYDLYRSDSRSRTGHGSSGNHGDRGRAR